MEVNKKALVPTTEKVCQRDRFPENGTLPPRSLQPHPTPRDNNHVTTDNRPPKAKKSPQLGRRGKKRGHRVEGKIFPCKTCLRPFANRTSAHLHARTHLNSDELERSSVFHEKCPHCEKVFLTRHQFTDHVNSHEGRKNHACPVCKQKFTQKTSLTRHLFVHLSLEERAEVRQGWQHGCYFCTKRFPAPSHLGCHVATHTKEKAGGKCHTCGKTFSSKQDLARHRFAHLSEDEKVTLVKQGSGRECLFCQKKFPDNHTYHKHLVSHTKEKPFPCDQCEKQFSLKSNLTMHKRSHTSNPKMVKCDECGQAFSRKQGLTRHKTTVHRKLKDFACPECGKKFGRKEHMVTHVSNVHAKIRHPCPRCGKTFTQKGNVGTHLKKFHPPE
ncbi:gastrula zinc finger protein XlCGF17.1-like [Folsomia candida]|uniref:gastrula zinc finger protein XlCGF17.1-like n=1 Tax=Folsomia candida TaxID=158441 RepID=UPI000B90A25D|nr:gastrula zinc finger protein XlCGF17.1-like [Folsomia candida]